jgi:hypothetical protein
LSRFASGSGAHSLHCDINRPNTLDAKAIIGLPEVKFVQASFDHLGRDLNFGRTSLFRAHATTSLSIHHFQGPRQLLQNDHAGLCHGTRPLQLPFSLCGCGCQAPQRSGFHGNRNMLANFEAFVGIIDYFFDWLTS